MVYWTQPINIHVCRRSNREFYFIPLIQPYTIVVERFRFDFSAMFGQCLNDCRQTPLLFKYSHVQSRSRRTPLGTRSAEQYRILRRSSPSTGRAENFVRKKFRFSACFFRTYRSSEVVANESPSIERDLFALIFCSRIRVLIPSVTHYEIYVQQ